MADQCEHCLGDIPERPSGNRGPRRRFCSRSCQVKHLRNGGEDLNVIRVGLTDDEHTALIRAARERDVGVKWLVRRIVVEGLANLRPASDFVLTRD